MQFALKTLLIASSIIVYSSAQTCPPGSETTTACSDVPSAIIACPANQTCIKDKCCPDDKVITTTTTPTTTTITTTPTTTTTVANTTTTTTTKKPTTITNKKPCVDLINPNTGVSDCSRMASYCNTAVYYDLMTKQCPRTCGRCSSSGGAPTSSCADKVNPSTGVSDCPKRAYLCNNSVYYALMNQECPRTCGRCNSG